MTDSLVVRILAGGLLLACGLAHGQGNSVERPCPFQISPNSPGYGKGGNPCAFTYRVPQDRRPQLIRENPQCTAYGLAVVTCPTAVVGNYGQVRIGANGNAQGRGKVYPEETLAHMNFPPNMTAQQIWDQGVSLAQRNRLAESAATFLKCSEMGNVRCTSALGLCYDQGRGVPLDRTRAVWYLTRAANGGNRGAQDQLGVYWEEGEVLPQDMKKAMEWYMKSAQQGKPEAERRIGLAYELGEILPRSRPLAIEWLSKAGAQGDGESAELARLLSNPNTPARFRDLDAISAYYGQLFQAQLALHTPHASGGGGYNGNAAAHNNAVNAYYSAGNPAGAATCAATPSCASH